jgi:hypothetical protein
MGEYAIDYPKGVLKPVFERPKQRCGEFVVRANGNFNMTIF